MVAHPVVPYRAALDQLQCSNHRSTCPEAVDLNQSRMQTPSPEYMLVKSYPGAVLRCAVSDKIEQGCKNECFRDKSLLPKAGLNFPDGIKCVSTNDCTKCRLSLRQAHRTAKFVRCTSSSFFFFFFCIVWVERKSRCLFLIPFYHVSFSTERLNRSRLYINIF